MTTRVGARRGARRAARRLPDAGLADQLERAGAAASEVVEGAVERFELDGPPDQLRRAFGHGRDP